MLPQASEQDRRKKNFFKRGARLDYGRLILLAAATDLPGRWYVIQHLAVRASLKGKTRNQNKSRKAVPLVVAVWENKNYAEIQSVIGCSYTLTLRRQDLW